MKRPLKELEKIHKEEKKLESLWKKFKDKERG
jgi:hypothetical protein